MWIARGSVCLLVLLSVTWAVLAGSPLLLLVGLLHIVAGIANEVGRGARRGRQVDDVRARRAQARRRAWAAPESVAATARTDELRRQLRALTARG